MEKTLKIINQMRKDGLFSHYAIGGGIAALFYIEPLTTFDLDIFIILPEQKSPLVSLTPIYKWLKKRGYKAEKEQITIEGIPVQFIPVYNDLIEDAVKDAAEKPYKKISTYVLKPEYLVAIMLQTFRPKDRERLVRFFEQAKISEKILKPILEKHKLVPVYNKFRRNFLEN